MCSNFFSLSIIQSEEKCNAVQERLEFVEQKLAEFSQKAEATAEKSLAQVISQGLNHLLIGAVILFLTCMLTYFNA